MRGVAKVTALFITGPLAQQKVLGHLHPVSCFFFLTSDIGGAIFVSLMQQYLMLSTTNSAF